MFNNIRNGTHHLEPLAVALDESEVGAAAADHYPCPEDLAALAAWPEA